MAFIFIKNRSYYAFLILLLCLSLPRMTLSDLAIPMTLMSGYWSMMRQSVGVSAMHMQLLHDGKVLIFDRTDFGPSNLSLPNGRCRYNPNDNVLKVDCTAHSLLYDPTFNTIRPLTVQTDTWCSSGSLSPNGTLIQTGGYNDGEKKIRTFSPCPDGNCDWVELEQNLTERRWYASNQLLPDGRVIIVGGRNVYSYEFFPKSSGKEKSFLLRFLLETRDLKEENNLYPFLHLLPGGDLFIFANKRSILLDYVKNRVIKEFPVMPGLDKRNYPSSGSSVLLPMSLGGFGKIVAEVMICGGAPAKAFSLSDKMRIFVQASNTCGRLRATDADPEWAMERMPIPRVMGDMVLLPSGDVLIVNGATNGTAGWEDATNAVYNPLLYSPSQEPTRRFSVMRPAELPRMYHSAAILLPDGRVLVGGSNPHVKYNFTAFPYPTDLSLEAFYPPYLRPQNTIFRPSILSLEPNGFLVPYKQQIFVNFVIAMYRPSAQTSVALVAPSFTTHSVGMNQRMLFLQVAKVEHLSALAYKVTVFGPPTNNVAPPGYYMLFVLHGKIPSSSIWVKVH